MEFVAVKLKKANVGYQLLDFDERPTWDTLSSQIVVLFHIPRDRVIITFRNVEKQFIDITNDDELQELYKTLDPNLFFLKFVVQDSQARDATISSTWSAGSNLSDLAKDKCFKLGCLVFKEPEQHFSVDALVGETVEDLKKKIKSILNYPDPHFKLLLWKLSPFVPFSRYTKLADFESPEKIPGAVLLGSFDPVSRHFLSASAEYLHIIVVVPQADNKGKRKAEAEPVEQGQTNGSAPALSTLKRMKLDDTLPSDDDLKAYHERLCNVPDDPLWYSDPNTFDRLPFPFTRPVPERFSLQNGFFEYMGREAFTKVYGDVSSLNLYGLASLYVYGTMGYGKSYVLAALACLLYRQGKRVVFIPDCRTMISDPLLYLQKALLCTFANSLLEKERELIRACASLEEVVVFCRSLKDPLYFIVDQVNAFEKSLSNTDVASNALKESGQQLIERLGLETFLITSASANYQTARYMASKQTGKKKLSLVGGMSKEEMTQWWKHHESKLPKFEDDLEKMELEDFTGCIPLLLQPLFRFSQQEFCKVKNDFRESLEIANVAKNIKEFNHERSKMGEQLYSDYIDTLFNCLTHGDAPSNRSESFDYRYFYHNNIIGGCTCGVAREAAAIHIAKWKMSRFYEPKWINSLRLFKDNPSNLGFQIEKICLACIADIGLNYGGQSIGPQVPIWFRGSKFDDLLRAIPDSDPSGLYLPLSTQFEDIDALILIYNKKTNTLSVIPIQITINKRHKDSESFFYNNNWEKLVSLFPEVTLISTFIWITELTKSSVTIEEEIWVTRTMPQTKMRAHQQIYLTAGDVHKPLGEAIKRIRDLQQEDSRREGHVQTPSRRRSSRFTAASCSGSMHGVSPEPVAAAPKTRRAAGSSKK